MTLHPKFRELLERMRTSRSVSSMPVADGRSYFAHFTPLCDVDPPSIECVEDIKVPVRGGMELDARLYFAEQPHWAEPQPVLLYFHSGAYVFGSIETAEAQCRILAIEARCAVLSIGYRLAPEFRFPVAVGDALESLIWLIANAHLFGLDPHRVAVGGESSGATIAAVTAVNARDIKIRLAMQMLIYPGLSCHTSHDSHRLYGRGFYLTDETFQQIQNLYLRNERDNDDWRFAPLDAAQQPAGGFANIAPALIISAQYDPLLDEQCLYARKLLQSGNLVHMCCYLGMVHGFFSMGRLVRETAVARTLAGQFLREAFNPRGEPLATQTLVKI
jgi:acetyl esterase